jgi:hypothetical protein
MVGAATIRHALDYELSVQCHVHLHAARHAQAARPLGRLVDMGKRLLQLWIVRADHAALDGEALGVHRGFRRVHRAVPPASA